MGLKTLSEIFIDPAHIICLIAQLFAQLILRILVDFRSHSSSGNQDHAANTLITRTSWSTLATFSPTSRPTHPKGQSTSTNGWKIRKTVIQPTRSHYSNLVHLSSSWGIIFSHPADFTPVCTTEMARIVQLMPEFRRRGVKPIALSCDSAESHREWTKDIRAFADTAERSTSSACESFPFPIIDDADRRLAVKFNMLDKDEIGKEGLPLTCRAVFIVDDKHKLRLSFLYPATTGRNFEWVLKDLHTVKPVWGGDS